MVLDLGTKSMENSTSLLGGRPLNSLGNTSGYSLTTGILSISSFSLACRQKKIIKPLHSFPKELFA